MRRRERPAGGAGAPARRLSYHLTRWSLWLATCWLCYQLAVAALSWAAPGGTRGVQSPPRLFANSTRHLAARELLLRRNATRLVFVTPSTVRVSFSDSHLVVCSVHARTNKAPRRLSLRVCHLAGYTTAGLRPGCCRRRAHLVPRAGVSRRRGRALAC